MEEKKQDTNGNFFDSGLFGYLIRKKRTDLGCKTVDEFSALIKERTGFEIPRGPLSRIESGGQEPKISQLIAIVLTLYGRLLSMPGSSPDPIYLASCIKWQEVENSYNQRQTEDFLERHGVTNIDGLDIALL